MSLGYDGRMRAAIARRDTELKIVKSEAESLKDHAAAQLRGWGESIGASLGLSGGETPLSWIRRHPWLMALGALAIGAVAAPGLRFGWRRMKIKREKKAAHPEPPAAPAAPAYFKAIMDAAVPVLIEAVRQHAAHGDGDGAGKETEPAVPPSSASRFSSQL